MTTTTTTPRTCDHCGNPLLNRQKRACSVPCMQVLRAGVKPTLTVGLAASPRRSGNGRATTSAPPWPAIAVANPDREVKPATAASVGTAKGI